MNDYTPPTRAQLDEAYERYKRAEDAYFAASKETLVLGEQYQRFGAEHIRLDALARPVREYVIDRLTRLEFTRKATAARIAPHHNPADVAQVLADLEREGLICNDPRRGWRWVA